MLITTHKPFKLSKGGSSMPISVYQSKGSISKALNEKKFKKDGTSTFKHAA